MDHLTVKNIFIPKNHTWDGRIKPILIKSDKSQQLFIYAIGRNFAEDLKNCHWVNAAVPFLRRSEQYTVTI
jgi:hypothetical protein